MYVTSARRDDRKTLSYGSARERMRGTSNNSLVIFGTGWGLTPEVLDGADGFLPPILGANPSGYNHLSVRAACAIMLDRLLRHLELTAIKRGLGPTLARDGERLSSSRSLTRSSPRFSTRALGSREETCELGAALTLDVGFDERGLGDEAARFSEGELEQHHAGRAVRPAVHEAKALGLETEARELRS